MTIAAMEAGAQVFADRLAEKFLVLVDLDEVVSELRLGNDFLPASGVAHMG